MTAAVGTVTLAVGAYAGFGGIPTLAGTSATTTTETGASQSTISTVDHAVFDALLHRHVRPGGWVDYQALREDQPQFRRYLEQLAAVPLDRLKRPEKLALLINAYNAFTLELILEHWPVDSIRDIPADQRWDARRWTLAGETVSLNQLEHEWVRANFDEPRIHFALVCAAVGCPPLRGEAYSGDRLEAQLAEQTAYVHRKPRWFRYDQERGTVYLTELYKWYGDDFKQMADSVLAYAARYHQPLKDALKDGQRPTLRWIDYDWSLNDLSRAPQAARTTEDQQ